MERGVRGREGDEESTVMRVYQQPTVNGIMMQHEHVPIKIKTGKKAGSAFSSEIIQRQA